MKKYKDDLNIMNTQEYELVYRRWVLWIPLMIIFVGVLILIFQNDSPGNLILIAYIMILIGILTFGALLVGILAISLSSKTLEKKSESHISFRERIEVQEKTSEKRTAIDENSK